MNVFKTLKRGNIREEEYFSASLGILLKEIPELTSFLIEKIFGIEIEIGDYEIELEHTFPDGRIDIVIKSLPLEVYIENKISADLGETQLERYYNYIHQISNKSKLILLSRDLIEDESVKYADKYIFWSELFTLIENFYKKHYNYIETKEGGKIYLLSQFLDFLREENMSNEKVSWEYASGLKSFLNLLNMIQSVLRELQKEKQLESFTRKGIGQDYAGLYINTNNKFWVGIYYAEPEKLYFEIREDFRKKYEEEVFKELDKSPGREGNPSYIYDFQKEYFLAFSKEEQKKAIYDFIRSSLSGLENLIKEKEGQ